MARPVPSAVDELLRDAPKHLLARVTAINGLKAAMLVTADGFEVANHQTDGINKVHLSALVSSLCGIGESAGRELSIGNLRRLVLESESGTVVVQPIKSTTRLLLCVVLTPDAILGHALWIVGALATDLTARSTSTKS